MMSDKNDTQKDKEKQDDEQPGTSENMSRKLDLLKSDESNQSPISFDKKKHLRFDSFPIKLFRNRTSHQGPHRSHKAIDQNLKYKIYIRPKGHQPSNLIKSLNIPSNANELVKVKHKHKLFVHSKTDLSKEKHFNYHLNDILYRPLHHLVCRRESLVELKRSRKNSRRESFPEKQLKKFKPYKEQQHRCQHCLHAVALCNCHLPVEKSKEKKSDWEVLTQRQSNVDGFQKNQTWTRTRIEWLEEIEATTAIDIKKIFNGVAVKQEICCFPFFTFRIFGKQEMSVIDYYRKKNE